MSDIQRFELDRWFAKTLDYPEWVKEVKENANTLWELYDNGTPNATALNGYSLLWKIYWEGHTPISHLLPSLNNWLKENNAEISYWFINELTTKSADNVIFKDPITVPDDFKQSLTIHTDTGWDWDKKLEHDHSKARDLLPEPKVTINIPLDDNDGFYALRSYSYGNPPARQVAVSQFGFEFDEHGVYDSRDVEMVFEELDAKNKPVMMNTWQPHSWHKTTDTYIRRLIIRLGTARAGYGLGIPHADPWHLFDAD